MNTILEQYQDKINFSNSISFRLNLTLLTP